MTEPRGGDDCCRRSGHRDAEDDAAETKLLSQAPPFEIKTIHSNYEWAMLAVQYIVRIDRTLGCRRSALFAHSLTCAIRVACRRPTLAGSW